MYYLYCGSTLIARIKNPNKAIKGLKRMQQTYPNSSYTLKWSAE